jgi:hypothetical protein
MAWDLSSNEKSDAMGAPLPDALFAAEARKVKQIRGFPNG